MTSENLAIVFAPNLLRSPVETPDLFITDTSAKNNMMVTLIDEYEYFFGEYDQEELSASEVLEAEKVIELEQLPPHPPRKSTAWEKKQTNKQTAITIS